MRLFSDISVIERMQIFYKEPSEFTKHTRKDLLAYAIGATLYMPATRPNIHQDLLSRKHSGLTSMVICLEDAIGDNEVELAESLLIAELENLQQDLEKGLLLENDLPLLFIRIRDLEQLLRLKAQVKKGFELLTGIVIPKFSAEKGRKILQEIDHLNQEGYRLYALPILETKRVIEKETRIEELVAIKNIVDQF